MAGGEQEWKAEKDHVQNSLKLWVHTELFWDLSNSVTKTKNTKTKKKKERECFCVYLLR